MARILFFQLGQLEHLGLLQVAANAAAAGHETALALVRGPSDAARAARDARPDAVGFAATTGLHHLYLRCAAAIRSASPAAIVIGGAHASAWPQVSEHPAIDFACVGEGEKALPALLDALAEERDANALPGIFTKANRDHRPPLETPVADLNELPPPARHLLYGHPRYVSQSNKIFVFSRGCPFACRHCTNAYYQALTRRPVLRLRSPELAVDELVDVRDRWGMESALLNDDIFGVIKEWTFEFLERYERRVRLPFMCHLMAGCVDPAVVAAMKRAGCYAAGLGVETGSERVRQETLGRRITREELLAEARVIADAGIKLEVTNIMGTPGETFDEALSTVRLNREIAPPMLSVTLFQPYPGTELARRALAAGLLPDDYVDRIGPTVFGGSLLRQPDIDRVINLHHFFIWLVRFPWLEPLLLPLTKLRPNRLFLLAFFASFFLRTERLYRHPWRAWLREIAFWWKALIWRDGDKPR